MNVLSFLFQKVHNIDICALSETKKKGKGNAKYQNYILFYSEVEKNSRAKAGVDILVHKKFENIIDEIEYLNQNIIRDVTESTTR